MFISYAQNFEDVMLWRAFKEVACGFYVDVGACDPTRDSVTKAFYARGWRGINVEPDGAFFDRLVSERPEDVNLGIAASVAKGVAPFYQISHRGLSTLRPELVGLHQVAGYQMERVVIETDTLAAICERHAREPIHFLKIDVEGSERDVLAGMDFHQWRPWVVVVEATRPNSAEPSYQEWEEIVTGAGYIFAYSDGLNRFYVAQEQKELLGAFVHPPNVFDEFVRASEHEAQVRAKEFEGALTARTEQLLRARDRADRAEADAVALREQVRALEEQLTAQTELRKQVRALEEQLTAQTELRKQVRALEEQAGARFAQAERAMQEAARARERAAHAEDEVVQSRAVARWAEHFERQLREREAQHSRRLHEQEEHYLRQKVLLEAVYRSRSWRLTAPYRALGWILRRPRQTRHLPAPQLTRKPNRPTLFIECTHTFHSDLNSGIQRVVRNVVRHAPVVSVQYGFDVVPVILEGDRFVPARVGQLLADKSRFQASPERELARQIDQSKPGARNAPSIMDEFQSVEGSVLLLLDSAWHLPIWRAVEEFKQGGGRVVGVIYDLIPITHSHTCLPSLVIAFEAWLREYLRHADASIGISRATGNELRRALASLPPGQGPSSHVIDHFYLGSELDLVHTKDQPRDEIRRIFDCDRHLFLMVGSIEPRKNHSYVLDAFERHWVRGGNGAIVIIGRYGWKNERFLERVALHEERDRRLFVVRDASDAELDYAYRNASALIIASEVEGFGLPVVEAFQRGLPVFCSDIAVFREIADAKAIFFELDRSESLTDAIGEFCRAHDLAGRSGRAPQTWITWQESTEQLCAAIVRVLALQPMAAAPEPAVLAHASGSTPVRAPGRKAEGVGFGSP